MKVLNPFTLAGVVVLGSVCQVGFGVKAEREQADSVRAYEVNKKVCDFAEGEDFSTPEAAYASINRLIASGDWGFWRRVSEKKLAARMSAKKDKRKISKTAAYGWLNAKIIEVRIFEDKFSVVLAQMPHEWKTEIDIRSFELENGQWKNSGNSRSGSVEGARENFDMMCGHRVKRPKRGKIANPETYLKKYIDFLKENGKDPKGFVLDALKQYQVVIIGEIHHRPTYWAFNSSLVGEPEFAEHVGVIYLELPANHQEAIDTFLAGHTYKEELVIGMLRDMLWMGWPDQPMLDFFKAVWHVNQNLRTDQKLRIVLVDMERPWEKIEKREDWRSYDVNRDKYMAETIINDIKNNPQEKRNRLFIVGVGHTALKFGFYGGHPHKTAGWFLNETLGEDKVFALMQHRCVMTNMGRVDGRVCLGLFDSAFAALQNRPVAFTLEKGPFGEHFYDAQPDAPVWSTYRDGFNGYLYLDPLEDEIFSPLIPDFYTDEFVKELERRYRLMYGKGWAEGYGIKESNADSFINWMSGKGGSWGRPRKWRNKLDPMDAWKYGDDWEKEMRQKKHESALENPKEIKHAARKLFDVIRNADYEYHAGGKHWQSFTGEDADYEVHHHFDSWVAWICKTFTENPITSVEIGDVYKTNKGLPEVPYVVRLRDGRELKGNLPFRYQPRQDLWMGIQGIDWHLQYKEPVTKGAKPEAEAPKKESKLSPSTELVRSSSIDRSTPENTVRSWTKAVATNNFQDAMACMLPGGDDYEDIEKILKSKPSDRLYFFKKIWLAIDTEKPIKILGKTTIEDEVSIGWKFYLKEDMTIEGKTFTRDESIEFDARLKKRGDSWLIDNI